MPMVFGPSQGSVTPAGRPAPPVPMPGALGNMSGFGADTDATVNRLTRGARISAQITGAQRPSNIWYRFNGQTAYWYQYALMDWYVSQVSVLSSIISRSCTELLRYGLQLVPKFAFKCQDCGAQSQNFIQQCPVCHSRNLRRPDQHQKEYFKRRDGRSFLDEANDNGQSLKDVLKAYAMLQYQNNQAYILCVTGDVIDPQTKQLKTDPADGTPAQYPIEFLVQDPKFVRFLYDDTGKGGCRYAFTRDDRNSIIDIQQDEGRQQAIDLTDDGKVLYPAYWQIGTNYSGTGQYWLYSKQQVYQDKWFKQSLTYGIPIWFDIEDDLLTYHYIQKHNLKKYKYGYVRKMVILPGFNDQDAEDIANGVRDVLATNDNSIPIICTPPQMPGVAEQRAQTLELGTQSSADLMEIKNDIRDRLCAHCGVPNIFAGDVQSSGGMNNESQQITTFDRYLMDKYEYLDRICKWIMQWFPSITDWALVVSRPSKAYTDFRKRMDELEFISGMKQMGFDVFYQDGMFRYSKEPIDQIQRRMEMQAQQQQAMMQQAMGGMPPGEEKPDKGTDRRDQPDIGASKQEVDQAMDEGQQGMSL